MDEIIKFVKENPEKVAGWLVDTFCCSDLFEGESMECINNCETCWTTGISRSDELEDE